MDDAFELFIEELSNAPGETTRTAPDGEAVRVAEIKNATLDALAEMRAIGMNFIRRLDKRAAGEMNEFELKGMERVGDDCVAFERMARAVRQIIALEQETVGIRPMPRPGGGSGGDNRSEGGGDGANDNATGRRERLRTGGTRGTRDDLKDAREKERAQAREKAFFAAIARIVAAADMELKAAGKEAEVAKAAPVKRATVMIYAVPRPNFEACLQAMSLEPLNAGTAALIRKMGKPGTYRPPYKPP
jgi:hypothetical protein